MPRIVQAHSSPRASETSRRSFWTAVKNALFEAAAAEEKISSGNDALDELLEGGFPKNGLIEILPAAGMHGELQMLLPAAAALGRGVWIYPSADRFMPYAPALEAAGIDVPRQLFVRSSEPKAAFEAAEEAAASGEADFVAARLPTLQSTEDRKAMRRLALSAEAAGTTVFVFRPAATACMDSPAKLRLQVSPSPCSASRRLMLVTVRASNPNSFMAMRKSAEISLFPKALRAGGEKAARTRAAACKSFLGPLCRTGFRIKNFSSGCRS